MVRPPEVLMEPCQEPELNSGVLGALRKGDTDTASVEYTRYVLDVRDAFDRCNGRLSALRGWCEGMVNGGGNE